MVIPFIKKLYVGLLDILAPPFCLSCKTFLDTQMVLCSPCRALIKPVVSKTVQITQTKTMPVLAIGAYEPPLRSLILAKSRSNRAISYQLGNLIWECSYIRHSEFDIIVPIPLHWTRYAWRGYNQAEEMAKIIAHKTGKQIVNLLRRVRRTPYQSQVRASERVRNVHNVFELIENEQYKNKKILIVDDLMTTGATLRVAAKQLLKLKPEKLTAVVAARVI